MQTYSANDNGGGGLHWQCSLRMRSPGLDGEGLSFVTTVENTAAAGKDVNSYKRGLSGEERPRVLEEEGLTSSTAAPTISQRIGTVKKRTRRSGPRTRRSKVPPDQPQPDTFPDDVCSTSDWIEPGTMCPVQYK